MTKRGLFMVVDGVDGCGKTTIVKHLRGIMLEARGQYVFPMEALKEGKLGKTFYERLKTGPLPEITEILGFAMAITETYYESVVPTLERGIDIVMDRWIPSFYAYQVVGRDNELAHSVMDTLMLLRDPDVYIYCKVDSEVATKRLEQRGAINYLDKEASCFKTRVDGGYQSWFEGATQMDSNVITLDCNQPLADILDDLKIELTNYLQTLEG